MTTALVLAGSRGPDDPLALYGGVTHKAMLEVAGEPMLLRVLKALEAAGFQRVCVAIERPELVEELAMRADFPANARIEALPAQDGPSASVATAFDKLGSPLLVTTADHALLRPEWVRHFLEHAPPGADIVAGVARAELVTAAAPEARRTFLRFSDGAFSGCNLFYLATPAAAGAVALWREAERERKRPLRLLMRLGPLTAANYALGRLSLGRALGRLGRLAGARAAVVELPFGEAAMDVDKPEDLELARRLAALN